MHRETHCVLVELSGQRERGGEDLTETACRAVFEVVREYKGKAFIDLAGDECWVVLGAEQPELLVAELEKAKTLPYEAALTALERLRNYWLETVSSLPVTVDEFLVDLVWEELTGDDGKHMTTVGSYLKTLVDLFTGEYTPESGFYSIPDRSTALSCGTLRRVRKRPEDFALVFFECWV